MPNRTKPSAVELASIVSIAADAVIAVDSEQRMTFFNEGAERTFGWSAEEVLGRPLDIPLPERFRDAHRRHIDVFGKASEAARRMGERLEIAALRKSGEEFPAEASIAKVAEDDEPIYTVVLRDVSERKGAEEARRRVVEERVARAAAQSSERRARILAEVGEILAEPLDPEAALEILTEYLARTLADYAVAYLLGEDGSPRRVAVCQADPGQDALVRRLLELYPPSPDSAFGAPAAIRTRERIFAARIDRRAALASVWP